MARFARLSLTLGLLGAYAGLGGCISSHPEPSLEVAASISSATLADDCAGERLAGPGLVASDCAEDSTDCGFCRQTTVYLQLEAGEGDGAVPVEVLEIRLIDLESGSVVDTLSASDPEIYGDDVYTSWDATIEAGQILDVRYPTSAPDWNTIGGGEPWSTHGMEFRIEMRVRIDGVERTLEFAPATREAEIVT
jgi:hypothetical protein